MLPEVLTLHRNVGNAAVTDLIARCVKPTTGPIAAPPRLRTALDSRVRVVKDGDGYAVALELSAAEQSLALVKVAEYRSNASTALRQLPIYLEDIVAQNCAVVNIYYDPGAVDVRPTFETAEVAGVQVSVKLHPSSVGDLTVARASQTKRVREGVTIEGKEKVTEHESTSATDKIMGSIASAEGGFASVEGSDAGVFTWGQGQWTVTSGELQRVLVFIKERRQDLFDRYFGQADLNIAGGDFIHIGKTWSKSTKSMMALFRPDIETITRWAAIFGQAGMDPQVQRLQREFLRAEVHETLGKHIAGYTPENVLNTRGQAFFYSMDKNLPAGATANFKVAVAKSGLPPHRGAVTDEQKGRVSDELAELFKHSSVVAYSNDKHHIIAFWGEDGRKRALDLADKSIAANGDGEWSVAQWKKYRRQMESRESRYSKTKADIDRALSRHDIEPDVPSDAVSEGEPETTPPSAPSVLPFPNPAIGDARSFRPAVAAPADRPTRFGADLFDEMSAIADLIGTGFGLRELRIDGSVGRGGKNEPHDVAQVRARLIGVGYPAGVSPDQLSTAIHRYQAEVVGATAPDGRVDPGGPTLRALNALRRVPAGPDHGSSVTRPAGPTLSPAAPIPPPTKAPAPSTPAVAVEPPAAAAVPTGPRAALSDHALEAMIGPLSTNPAVVEVARDLAVLEHQTQTIQRDKDNQELAKDRDQLVADIGSLRLKIAALDKAGLRAEVLDKLKALLYRAIDQISPYYYQAPNIDILETANATATCNITSLSMALEGLGKSPGNYKGDKQTIAEISQVYRSELAGANDRVGSALTGLRLPDYLELVAIARVLVGKSRRPRCPVATPKAIQDAVKYVLKDEFVIGNVGFLVGLAEDFGVPAHYKYLEFGEANKKNYPRDGVHPSETLKIYGKEHRKAGEREADSRNEIEHIDARLSSARGKDKERLEKQRTELQAKIVESGSLSTGKIERELPLERYKETVIHGIMPEVDAGNQVVVGLYNHFVRLQSLDDDHIVVDDPGRSTRANLKITWEEARAMGYFWVWIVVGS
ncbi:MAG TPA: hypothetical protein VFW21_08740 [Mycobacterium sp.]|nr:hypothetical protein [Mycobacterium sp.]